jgi:hypothetical protein
MNLHDVLMKKAAKHELAHFYIVEGTGLGGQEALEDFVHKFIRDYYREVEGHKQSMTHLMDHPDVYVLGNLSATEDPESANYTVEEALSLARFFEFRPVQSRRKFVVITEAHRINNIIANKWLKLFEEPQGESTIFLLNPRRMKLLETIHSRALHLRPNMKITHREQKEWKEFLAEVKEQSLATFLERNIKGEYDLSFWVGELIHWESTQLDGAASKTALKEWLTNFQEMDIFHQPAATKWSLFYSYLQQHVLPRTNR